ncbi:16562_t:CDS:1, partial [Racocetra persica]
SETSLLDDIMVDNNEIDLKSFFEAAYHSSVDVETLNENIEAVIIVKAQTFDDFDQAEKYI